MTVTNKNYYQFAALRLVHCLLNVKRTVAVLNIITAVKSWPTHAFL